jgi:type I restriction enzyme, S subunit
MNHRFDQFRLFAQTRDLLFPRLISGKLSVENLDIKFPPSMRDEAPETAFSET